MSVIVAERMKGVPKSFIREILKITQDPSMISFAGGLPNPDFFPIKQIEEAADKVLRTDGKRALQYSTTEGHLPLREWICERIQKKKGFDITPDQVLITNGSQQAIALLCKSFVNRGDKILLERPAYLGAIQAMSFYEPAFVTAELHEDGIDTGQVFEHISKQDVKLYYAVPNFQNPTGISYSLEVRKRIAAIMAMNGTIYVEDDPYFDIRFEGNDMPSIRSLVSNNIITLGSFSKSVCPGFRLGWITAQPELMQHLVVSKQAADLHSGTFTQLVMHQFLMDNDLDLHVAKIRERYKAQKDAMVEAMKLYFPPEVKFTNPQGGMFLWVTLPEGLKAMELLEIALKAKLAFVPGETFYVDGKGQNTIRVNYTNSPEEKIVKGVQIMAKAIKELMVREHSAVGT